MPEASGEFERECSDEQLVAQARGKVKLQLVSPNGELPAIPDTKFHKAEWREVQ